MVYAQYTTPKGRLRPTPQAEGEDDPQVWYNVHISRSEVIYCFYTTLPNILGDNFWLRHLWGSRLRGLEAVFSEAEGGSLTVFINLISPGRKVAQERNTHAPASEFDKESNAIIAESLRPSVRERQSPKRQNSRIALKSP